MRSIFKIIKTDGFSAYEGVPLVLALGNFDGVHLGHRQILCETVSLARRLGAAPAFWMFDVHPQRYFGNASVKLITSADDRMQIMKQSGMEYAVIAEFGALKDMAPSEFLSFLKNEMNCVGAVCGYNFSFGKRGSGRADDVKAFFGDAAHVVPHFTLDGESVSSSRVREMIEAGEMTEAARLLGRLYSVSGEVVSGRRIGRQMDFPTANIIVPSDVVAPREGVYATFAEVGGKSYPAVTNYGTNPTVTDLKDMRLETHISGFDGDIYGNTIRISFIEKIRSPKKFASLDELKNAIAEDKKRADAICSAYENKN